MSSTQIAARRSPRPMNAPLSPSARAKHTGSPTPRPRSSIAHVAVAGRELSPSPSPGPRNSQHSRRELAGERRSEQRQLQNQAKSGRGQGTGGNAKGPRENKKHQQQSEQDTLPPKPSSSSSNTNTTTDAPKRQNQGAAYPRSPRGKRSAKRDGETATTSSFALVDEGSNPFLNDLAQATTPSPSSTVPFAHSYPPTSTFLATTTLPPAPNPITTTAHSSFPNIFEPSTHTQPDANHGRLIESLIKQKLGIGITSPPPHAHDGTTPQSQSTDPATPPPSTQERQERPPLGKAKLPRNSPSAGAPSVDAGSTHPQNTPSQSQGQSERRKGKQTHGSVDRERTRAPSTPSALPKNVPTSPSNNPPAPPSTHATPSTPAPSSSPRRFDHYYAGGAFAKSPSPAALPVPAFTRRSTASSTVATTSDVGGAGAPGSSTPPALASSYPPRPPPPPAFLSGTRSRAESGSSVVFAPAPAPALPFGAGLVQRSSDWDVFAAGGGMEGVGSGMGSGAGSGGMELTGSAADDLAEKSRRLLAMLGAGPPVVAAGWSAVKAV
ncbi:hypothetical protein M427DRAFT_57469 [Gonapodya prolifera JEL478]|uniref:Uncharacterized protein n=1 Tax=Gonapodya prolifera (strain JEL478) TaxID=1344416 RepID=A0A139ADP0_GONPJ|nr:hypothetical protein M427DRAFT_57469 [Gonapodya prolifera JEL478]|eukprot:KXS14555.1 hypothetical protein M427DRAFT_57469 [Gonapodya prolifera JEL478]